MFAEKGQGIQIDGQIYDQTSIVNKVRAAVDSWRQLKDPKTGASLPKPRGFSSIGVTTISTASVRSFVRWRPSRPRFG